MPPAADELLIEMELRVRREGAEQSGKANFRYSKFVIDAPWVSKSKHLALINYKFRILLQA